MKILYWTELFWPSIGGVEILSAQLLPALREAGHEIVVVTSNTTPTQPEEQMWQGILLHRFFFRRTLARRDLKEVKRLSERIAALKAGFAPDVIHVNTTDPGVFFHLTTRGACPARVALTVHAFSPIGGPESIETRMIRSADWVVGESAAVLEDARRLVPALAANSSFIHPTFRPDGREPAPPPAAPLFLAAGRLIPEKGFDVAVKAFRRIAARFPEARLVIAGDGDARADLTRLVAEQSLDGRVEFRGWVAPERMANAIRASIAVVVPSRWKEPFGIVAVQAGQESRPVIASRTGGLPEIVVDGKTGLLVEPGNETTLAEAMAFLVEHPQEAARLGAAGRRRTEAIFGWPRFVREHEELYRRLVWQS